MTAAKLAETRQAIEDGAQEIDMVINISDVKNGDYDKVEQEIIALKAECGNRILKVIVETCYLTEEEKIKMLTDKFGGQAKRVLNAYESVYPEMDISYATCVDTMVRSATVSYLNLRTQSTCAPVYNYIFCFESVFMGGQLTGHNGDLHFMFHNACHIPAMCRKGITVRLQNEMAGAWASFARTGNPNAEGLIFWPEYDCLKKSCMMFGNQTMVKENHDEVLLKEIQND